MPSNQLDGPRNKRVKRRNKRERRREMMRKRRKRRGREDEEQVHSYQPHAPSAKHNGIEIMGFNDISIGAEISQVSAGGPPNIGVVLDSPGASG
ncbi:hypothetical protein [Oryza sativa Japonica Group]|uniref:Uncharacterized protein n=1 Tax=Oryza sativa subsp. japonica TaxID=39947 RepID=Q5QM13_ORYSJ|nr:hypothetical protein [Oryza sativa Japonica Group]